MVVYSENINWPLILAGYPGCQLINLEDHFDLKKRKPLFVLFYFNRVENMGISLKLEDKFKTLKKRSLRSDTRDYVGPNIVLNLNDTEVYRYFVEISQTLNLESYLDVECKNYPNEEFASFSSCDESYVYNKMKSHKVMPFWAAQNLDDVTHSK